MPEKPTQPLHVEIGGEVEKLRDKIRQACAEMHEASSKSQEAVALAREVIAKAAAALARR